MARFGAEMAVAAVLRELQLSLSAILTRIETDADDSLDLTDPDYYSDVQLERFEADKVQVEVWAERLTFPLVSRDASTWHASYPREITQDIEIFIRVAHAQRDGVTRGQMHKRSMRYGAAILRVLTDEPDLHGLVSMVSPIEQEISREEDGREMSFDRVTTRIEVRKTENNAGEGSPVSLPSYDIGTV